MSYMRCSACPSIDARLAPDGRWLCVPCMRDFGMEPSPRDAEDYEQLCELLKPFREDTVMSITNGSTLGHRRNKMNRCIAYNEDGRICGRPATKVDPRREGLVCGSHGDSAAELVREIYRLAGIIQQHAKDERIQNAARDIVKLLRAAAEKERMHD